MIHINGRNLLRFKPVLIREKEVFIIHLCLHVVFNLTNNLEVERTRQIMEQYQRENRDVIQRNKVKLVSTMVYVYEPSQCICIHVYVFGCTLRMSSYQ